MRMAVVIIINIDNVMFTTVIDSVVSETEAKKGVSQDFFSPRKHEKRDRFLRPD